MTFQTLLANLQNTGTFWLLAAVAIVSALAVVAFRNIVYSAFSLVLTFVAMAGLYMLLEADFLAMVQILVYAGAISIILVFAIMLTRRPGGDMRESNPFGRYKWLAGLVAFFLFVAIESLVLKMEWAGPAVAQLSESTIGPLAEAFLTTYVVPLETAALLLLVAMVGAIILAKGVRSRS